MSEDPNEAVDCIFCSIAAGTTPSESVAATTRVYAFRDLHPVAPTHVLIVPRRHLLDISAIDASHGELLGEMMTTAQQVAASEGIAETGYRLVFNIGRDGGRTVSHLHMHLLGGRRMTWPPG
jgi:histidine triad (HIT) family protein